MRLLVTGGAGFIGGAFARLALEEGMDVTVVDSLTYAADRARLGDLIEGRGARLIEADVAHKGAMRRALELAGPEAIVHLAAETHVDRSIQGPDVFLRTNVIGTANLLELAAQCGVRRFLHVSTDEVYGDLPLEGAGGFHEDAPLRPSSPYSASKAAAEMYVRAYHRTRGLQAMIVRPCNNYGPWQYPEKLIPLAMARLLEGRRVPLYGAGLNVRTWLYVEDCARALMAALLRGRPGECYNVGGPDQMGNIEVVAAICRAMGRAGAVEEAVEFVPDRPGHDLRYALECAKLRDETGWTPQVSFEEGIVRTVRWYSGNRAWLSARRALAAALPAFGI